ncbi:Rqc2 family fibronectin-binding protein [Clostridium sp.]|uniref:Rqc2 family fibronectin-binding protein n=1 Tax=Clostridium sp. TaxID=1506 RepID=UPI003F3F24F4
MALDGIYLYSLLLDFKSSILGAKIDKINQPEKDEIIITVRKDRKNLKLLISASSKFPRIHLTEATKVNPIQAPLFTMVLRKYLIGGRITSVNQIDGDRILEIEVESTDELGFDSKYTLIIEIMGRHSNITLVRKRDNKVVESIKHITPDINSYRVVYPGTTFVYPPKSKKLNPFDFSFNDFKNYIEENDLSLNENFYSNIFTGISKPLSTHLYNATKDKNLSTQDIYELMLKFVLTLPENISHKIFSENGLVKDFYCLPLSNYSSSYEDISFQNPHNLLDEFFSTKDKQERLNNRSIDLQRFINTNIERCLKKEQKLNNILLECNEKESFRIKGDLLTSYIYTINKGDKEAHLLNFYSENEEYLTIKLDENKTPSENIQFFYKKYNKLKKSEESALEQLEKNEEELTYLNSVLVNILNCDSYLEIEDIKKELIETGYLRFRKINKSNKKEKTSKPLHFVSSEGIDIYVGKNNIQNEYLSLKFANKNYMWFHTKNIPGSHVIVCTDSIKDTTFEEAATIAAFYSKAKNSTKVPVDYTKVKNLKKPSGAKPGMVIYHTNYSMYAEPQEFKSFKIENEQISK